MDFSFVIELPSQLHSNDPVDYTYLSVISLNIGIILDYQPKTMITLLYICNLLEIPNGGNDLRLDV